MGKKNDSQIIGPTPDCMPRLAPAAGHGSFTDAPLATDAGRVNFDSLIGFLQKITGAPVPKHELGQCSS